MEGGLQCQRLSREDDRANPILDPVRRNEKQCLTCSTYRSRREG